MKAVVAAFNQEKALVWAFSVITNLLMELFQALARNRKKSPKPSQTPSIIQPKLLGLATWPEAWVWCRSR